MFFFFFWIQRNCEKICVKWHFLLQALESLRQVNDSSDAIDAINKTNNYKFLHKRSTNDEDKNFYKYALSFSFRWIFFILSIIFFLSFFIGVHHQLHLFSSHFEDGGSFSENSSLEYSISVSDSSNPITPVSYNNDGDVSSNFLNSFDFGEVWMDSTADILPNNVKHAVCGKLTEKYEFVNSHSMHVLISKIKLIINHTIFVLTGKSM